MRGFKNFKGSDSRCPSIHFLFHGYCLHWVEQCCIYEPEPLYNWMLVGFQNVIPTGCPLDCVVYLDTKILIRECRRSEQDSHSDLGRSIIRTAHIYIFVYTYLDHENNRFQKNLIIQKTNIWICPPPCPLSIFLATARRFTVQVHMSMI